MKIDSNILFGVTDWDTVTAERHEGTTGYATWRVKYFSDVRLRRVEYSANYLADHWCKKGHFIFCLEGEMTTALEDGREFVLKAGMSYQVGDDAEAHRTRSERGVKLFIVD
ncbi:MAG: DHCW motif cupin fold protein [Bacteroidetes bacterium]|nr:DHCW motif cupin fold protein [Bacteroidota bacterium]